MTNDESKKPTAEELEKEYGITDEILFKNLEKSVLKRSEISKQQVDFTRGILYGLFFGILGNMLVQFGYQVYEQGILGNYNGIFWLNIIVFLFSLVFIAVVTRRLKKQIGNLSKSEEMYSKIGKVAIAELERRNAEKSNKKS